MFELQPVLRTNGIKRKKADCLGVRGWVQGFSLKACLLFQDAPPRPDMEQRLRSASSVDELMTLIYPSFWATLKCTSKLSSVAASSRSQSSGRPPASTGEPAFSAVYLNLDVLKSTTFLIRFQWCRLAGLGRAPAQAFILLLSPEKWTWGWWKCEICL